MERIQLITIRIIILIICYFSLLFSSCVTKEEFAKTTGWIYENKTSYTIEFTEMSNIGENLILKPDETVKTVFLFESCEFSIPFIHSGEIKYDDLRCETMINERSNWGKTGEGPFNFKNYEIIKSSDSRCQFKYTFTEKDFERAKECN